MIIVLVSQRSYSCWHHCIPHHSQVGQSGTTMRLTRKTQRMTEKTSCSTVSHPAHHAIPRSIPRLRSCIRMWVLTDSSPPATLIMHGSYGLWQLWKTEVPFPLMKSLGKMVFWVSLGKFGEDDMFVWVCESLGKMAFQMSLGKFGENGTLGESWKAWGKWHLVWVLESLGKMVL